MTLDELAKKISKCKATVSKYEKGEITLDIITLYDIADALQIHVEQLLYCRPERTTISSKKMSLHFLAAYRNSSHMHMTDV